ncbi:uncharacterized protein B0I36DRAFT_329392 [Microdochium trichocladiopsis]|uniref:Rhodopsin domain-containing protein n=1 Tax=Microdochium trichocladiopsis TaxID=1682393 RepID=A0A9P8Y2C5_9PEZI|nr:uncharacterized protein B0I36DRAFT_329392 [Microdochium trichocladiopsis]KAH7025898.1 hypothetical protein B0I36DRAFT_329392 [Microdochium trichocladiopsis]
MYFNHEQHKMAVFHPRAGDHMHYPDFVTGAQARSTESEENRGPLILGTICAVTALSTLFSAGRLLVRGKLKGRLLLDDYFIAISVLCTWLTVVFQFMAVRSGNGRHLHALTPEQRDGVAHWTIIGFVPGIMSFATPKLATIDLLCHILLPSRNHRVFMWLLGWTCWIQLMVTVVFLFVKCDGAHPTPADSVLVSPAAAMQEGCLDPWVNINYDVYTGAFSAFVDLYLAVYPTVVLCKLRLSIGKKIGLSIALGFGFVSTVVAIYKCTMIPSLESPDFSYDSSTLVIWTCVEGSTIIIAACIPILKPLLDLARAGCSQATASVCGGFPSRHRTVSTGAEPGGKNYRRRQQAEEDDDLGHSLFRLGTRTGVIAGGPTRGHLEPDRIPDARLKASSFSHQHHCRSRHDQHDSNKGAKDAVIGLCSTSSQDSILRTGSASDEADTEDTERGGDVHNQAQQPATLSSADATKNSDMVLQHGGIMRTDSIEISFKPASVHEGHGCEVARAL